ncbi:hypothetical protein GTQ99_16345 [Kineococcus sp. T13]|uniref:hypothetical protein n=1 Tax=Kineococcus vitellinus TaxID=2696565 RepID=UPI001412F740|nr:hypothetical protein [Kineococcus vitellinus]NAZ76979.1 hypothetical protein [Kineococcus vitellinus]
MTALWTGLGDKVVDRFTVLLLSPALAFWFGGVLAWVHAHGWNRLLTWSSTGLGETDAVAEVAIGLGALLVIAGSARMVEVFSLPVLRLLEGYWPAWASALGQRVTRREERIERRARRWRKLSSTRSQHTMKQARQYQRLNAARARVPIHPTDRMPTAFGDLLKVMETRPRHRYGLDAVTCFPRLWLVLPEAARTDVAAARGRVDDAGRLWLWSLLFSVWTPLAWWAAVVAVAGMLVAYQVALVAAAGLAEVVQACFDVYRGLLYDALGFARPASLEAEPVAGAALTAWLERGRLPA